MQRYRDGLWAAAALVVGTLLRLWFIRHHPVLAGDALVYGGIARNLLLHGVFGFNEQVSAAGLVTYAPTLIRLPGYPLFLALCFRVFGIENYAAVLYVQLIADLLTCTLAARIVGRFFGRRAGLAALWIGAMCPFTANYVATPITEVLVLFFIALTFYTFVRWQDAGKGYNRWLWMLAVSLSASLLLRPEQCLLSAAVLPCVLWISMREPRGRAWGRMAAVGPVCCAAICVVLPLLPWTVRNWRTFHVFEPLAPRSAADPGEASPNGFNLWYRTWGIDFASTDQVYWKVNGDSIDGGDLPDRAYALTCFAGDNVPREALPLYAETTALLKQYNAADADTTGLDAQFAALAHRRMHASPLCSSVVMPVSRLLNMIFRPRVELFAIPDDWWKPPAAYSNTLFAIAYSLLGALYIAGAAAGFVRWRRWAGVLPAVGPLLVAMTLAVIARAALLLTLDNSEPRYTLEFFPIFVVLAGALFAESSACIAGGSEEIGVLAGVRPSS